MRDPIQWFIYLSLLSTGFIALVLLCVWLCLFDCSEDESA